MRRLAALALLLLALTAAPAGAAPGDELGDPERCANVVVAPAPADSTTTGTTTPPNDDEADEGICGKGLDALVGGENPGPYPTENYDLGNSNGTWCVRRPQDCIERVFWGSVMRAGFGVNGWVARTTLGFTESILNFRLAEQVEPVATEISRNYQVNVIDRMGLAPLMLILTGGAALWLFAIGRRAQAWTEIGTSVVLAALTLTILANPGGYLTSGLRRTRELSAVMTAAATGQDPTALSDRSVSRPMIRGFHKVTVERPHEIWNWGPQYPSAPACSQVYDRAVATGPWAASAKPRDAMKNAGCKAEYAFNKDPSQSRVWGAWWTALNTVILMVFVGILMIAMLACELGVLAAIVTFPFACLAARLPGRWRAGWWLWCGWAAMALGGLLALGALLSWVLGAIWAVLNMTQGVSLFMQQLVITTLALIGIAKQKDIRHGTKRAVGRAAARAAGFRVSGAGASFTEGPALGPSLGATAGGAVGAAVAVRRLHDNHERRSYQRESRAYYREQRAHKGEPPEPRSTPRSDAPDSGPRGDAPDPGVTSSYVAGHRTQRQQVDRVLAGVGGTPRRNPSRGSPPGG